MRTRVTAVILGVAGLLVAIAVGLAANSIASRSFTPGADALPSAGSLAPRLPASGSDEATTTPATAAKPKPRPKPKPAPTPVTTAPATTDDHGGGKGSGTDSSGNGGSSSHGGKGSDD